MTRLLGNRKVNISVIAALLVLVIAGVFVALFYWIRVNENIDRYSFQHLETDNIDPGIGPVTIPEDGIIDPETFETHLPLVVIDTYGVEVPNIYKKIDDMQTRGYADPNITDPFIDVHFEIINNGNGHNRLVDEPEFTNNGRIKIRGNSSRSFEKKQYGIKLLDEDGNELEQSLLGMEPDEDWILSNSILDASYIRSYMAFSIGGIIMPFTPQVKFCELVYRTGDDYEYKGLYLLTETVKKAKGRVDIATYEGNPHNLSYIIDRDRYDTTTTMLSTYASDQQLCYGWFTLCYPKNELADPATIKAIEDEVSTIEKVLYSDDESVFKTYPLYIDVDSFIDYMIFNEFFMNYDAGEHSTYYYKDKAHKLSVGPIWDYDNCFDNYKEAVGGISWMVFPKRAWYDCLVKDRNFTEKLCRRYHQLRKSILSDEFVKEFAEGTVAYLGNAALRERSRWGRIYEEKYVLRVQEGDDGLIIDRTRDSHVEEVERLIDVQQLHARWMDKYIEDFLYEYSEEEKKESGIATLSSALALLMVMSFITSIIIVTKLRKGVVQ